MSLDLHAFEKFFHLSEPSDDWIDPEEVKRIRCLEEEEIEIQDVKEG